jgi:hypothetical protein
MQIQHELGIAVLFIIALGAFTVSLVEFVRRAKNCTERERPLRIKTAALSYRS